MVYNEQEHPRDTSGKWVDKTTSAKPGELPDNTHTVFMPQYGGTAANITYPSDTDFSGQSFENCTFKDCSFAGCDLFSMDLENATFEGCDFTGVDLGHARTPNATFKNCNMSGATFEGAKSAYATFEGCDLTDSNLHRANLDQAQFTHCKVHDADVTDTRLSGAKFTGCQFEGSSFDATDLHATTFESCDLIDTDVAPDCGAMVNLSGKPNTNVRNTYFGSSEGIQVFYSCYTAGGNDYCEVAAFSDHSHGGPRHGLLNVSTPDTHVPVQPDSSDTRNAVQAKVGEEFSAQAVDGVTAHIRHYMNSNSGTYKMTNIPASLYAIDPDDFNAMVERYDSERA